MTLKDLNALPQPI